VPAGRADRRFGDIIDELATKLSAHLAHEETDGLAGDTRPGSSNEA